MRLVVSSWPGEPFVEPEKTTDGFAERTWHEFPRCAERKKIRLQ